MRRQTLGVRRTVNIRRPRRNHNSSSNKSQTARPASVAFFTSSRRPLYTS